MDSSLVESSNSLNFQNSDFLTSQNYELTLKQSIGSLLEDQGTASITRYRDTFYELIKARADLPLESIWIYATLSFRSRDIPNNSHLDQLGAARDLFQLVSTCSASCSSSKSIALLAPVMFKVYGIVAEVMKKDLTSKREKKAFREAKSLIEVILGYMNACCSDDWSEEINSGSTLQTSMVDLIRIWIDLDEPLESFFPLVGDGVFRELCLGEFDVLRMAGAAMGEAFLIKLLLNLKDEISKQDLEKELRNWVVGSITCFRNIYLFENLLTTLLEETLPMASLISSEDDILLRKVLYDSVILVEYSFLTNEKALHLPAKLMTSLAMTRLVVIHAALQFSRQHGDQKRVLSYINAFSSSSLASQIIQSFSPGTPPVEEQSIRSSPITLIQWLLKLEEYRGIRVFDDGISKFRAKLLVDVTKSDVELHESKSECDRENEDLVFYIDSKGEDENREKEEDEIDRESMSSAFIAAAQTFSVTGKRLRKGDDEKGNGKRKDIKYVKYDLSLVSNSTRSGEELKNKNLSSDSEGEVENPLNDED